MTVGQASIYDPGQAHHCPAPGCGSIRLPGQTGPVVSCTYDLDRANGKPLSRRHRGCLNSIRPENEEIPF